MNRTPAYTRTDKNGAYFSGTRFAVRCLRIGVLGGKYEFAISFRCRNCARPKMLQSGTGRRHGSDLHDAGWLSRSSFRPDSVAAGSRNASERSAGSCFLECACAGAGGPRRMLFRNRESAESVSREFLPCRNAQGESVLCVGAGAVGRYLVVRDGSQSALRGVGRAVHGGGNHSACLRNSLLCVRVFAEQLLVSHPEVPPALGD